MKKTLIALVGFIVVVLLASFLAPLPVPYYQDFSVMYFTNQAFLQHIPIYDYPAQLAFVKTLTPPGFEFHPYPYPPWYVLSTFYLAFFPIQVAARIWFFMNFAMLCLVSWLLTPAWHSIRRILAILAAVLFIPVLGLLVVGQYSLVVLLGAALFIHAARRKLSFWVALALLLMNFKPHIGGFLILGGLAWLFFEKSDFSRRALALTFGGGVLLAGLGFLASPAWPLAYLQSLARYGEITGVQTCGLCASLPVMLAGQGGLLAVLAWSLGLAALLGILSFVFLRARLKNGFLLISLLAVFTLLVDPYLLNYDYILLLLPLFWLAAAGEWLALPVYFLPWMGLLPGWQVNIVLLLAGIVTFILILRPVTPKTSVRD